MKVINDKKRLLFTLKEKTSGPLVVAPEELTLVDESLKQTTGGGSEVAIYCSTIHIVENRGVPELMETVDYITSNIVTTGTFCVWDTANTRLMISIPDNAFSFTPSFVEVNLLNSVTTPLLFQEKISDPINHNTVFYFVFIGPEGDLVLPNTFLLYSPLLLTIKIY